MNTSPHNPDAVASIPPLQSAPISLEMAQAIAVLKNASRWWYWIAGLTAANSAVELFGGSWHFMLGTGITQAIDVIALQGAPSAGARTVAIAADALIVGLIALWGMLCGRGMRWAFITGMALYALDAVIVGLGQEWFSAAFHVYALFRLGLGLRAAGTWQRLKKEQRLAADAPQFGFSTGQTPGAWPPAPNSTLAGSRLPSSVATPPAPAASALSDSTHPWATLSGDSKPQDAPQSLTEQLTAGNEPA